MRLATPVPLVLMAVALAGLAGLGFVTTAPNRIVAGVPVSFAEVAGLAGCVAEGAAMMVVVAGGAGRSTSIVRPSFQVFALLGGAGAAAALVMLIGFAGFQAAQAAAAGPPAVRTSLGPGFWIAAMATVLSLVDAVQRLGGHRLVQGLLVIGTLIALAALVASGTLAQLSLAKELSVRAQAFTTQVIRHVELMAGAVALTALIGLPLGIAAARRAALKRRIMPVLNIVQTVPSIALFGLLIGPLSALVQTAPALRQIGISGIGPTPALIALVLYGLLPLVRTTIAALEGVSPAARDAARGAGMSGGQMLVHVDLPLALPVIVTGLRIVAVQTVGLTVVAALIGAGGLGTFVFQGLGQNAMDLVLLGALPTVALALLVDAAFGMMSAVLKARA